MCPRLACLSRMHFLHFASHIHQHISLPLGSLPQWLTNHLHVGLADVSVRLVGPRDTLVASLGSFCLAPVDGGRAIKMELLHVAIYLLLQEQHGHAVLPLLPDAGMIVTLELAGGMPCGVDLRIGSGKEGLLDQPIGMHLDACRRHALIGAWQCLGRKREVAESPFLSPDTPVQGDELFWDACASGPASLPFPARVAFSSPGIKVLLGLDAEEANDVAAEPSWCIAQLGTCTFEVAEQNVVASLASGAMLVKLGDQLPPSSLLQIPRIDFDGSFLSTFTRPCSWRIRAGVFTASWSSALMHRLVQLLEPPVPILPAPISPTRATSSTNSAQATTNAFISGEATGVVDGLSGILASFLSQRLGKHHDMAGVVEAAEGEGMPAPPPSSSLLPPPLTSALPLPLIDVDIEGVQLVLPPLVASTSSPPFCTPKGLMMALGRLTMQTGGTTAIVRLARVGVTLGHIQLLNLDETLAEVSSGAARATQGHAPPEGIWPPQDAEEWREAKAALWELQVTLPALRASLELDHVMEAIWLATKSTPRREGPSTSGPPTQSRRQAHLLPKSSVKLPLLRLQVKCPTVDLVLLPGTRHEGLPAVGPSMLEASMPWYAPDDRRRSDPLLCLRLSQGIKATYALGNGCLTPASFVARVEMPVLQIISSASTADSLVPLGATQVVVLDLKALEWSFSSFPAHCHWTPAPGPWGAHFWIGVAEQMHKHSLTAQYVEIGLEPSLVGRLSHLAQALKHVPIVARGVQAPVAFTTSAPCGVPLAPLLTLAVLLPAQTRVTLYWTESTGTATVASLFLTETRISLSTGVVGGRLTLDGSVQDFDILDGSPAAPELQKVLCRLRTEPQSQQPSAPSKMLTFQFEGWSGGDGPRLLLQASEWRFVYLQRITMELVGYIKDCLIPSFGRAASVRPQDVLSGSVVHLLATITKAATPWIQGIPKQKPAGTTTTSKPSPSPATAFRLQILLINSRALLANSSDSPDGLIVDFERYRLWRAPNTEREDAYWQGPELVGSRSASSSRGCESATSGTGNGSSSSCGTSTNPSTSTNTNPGSFYDPSNDPRDMLAVAQAELNDVIRSADLLAAESSRLVDALATKQPALDALQAQLPLGRPYAQLAAQRAIVDELEQRLASRRVVEAQVTARKQRLEEEVVRWEKCARAAPKVTMEAPGHPRWQHGRGLPSKPANRLDMDLEGATISTWKAGVVGKDITIHGYIEPGRLSFPFANPPGVYPEVYEHLGWERYIGWDTNNTAVVVALFVHELEWVLSRSQYSNLLSLLMENTREPCLFVPVLHPLPPPPAFEEIETGPTCITVPPSVSVPVYFKHAIVRLVEDVVQCGSEAAVDGGPLAAAEGAAAPLAGWSEEDDEQELEEEEEDQSTASDSGNATEMEGEGEDARFPGKQQSMEEAAAGPTVIALEEIQGKEGMGPPLLRHQHHQAQHQDGSFLCSRLLPGMPQRSGWQQVPSSEYVATVTLTMARLSIDRRPNNKGLELSVTAEEVVIESEEALLDNSSIASQPQVESAKSRPSKILFPSSHLSHSSSSRVHGNSSTDAGDTTMPRLQEHLQLRYVQQNLACYRRCVVELGRSVVVGAGDRLLRVVDFFVQPVRERNAQGPPITCEQAKNLDVEVSVEDSLLCLQEDCQRASSAALFMLLQCDYTQKWRGLVEGGPGTVDATIDVGLLSVFFSRQGLVLGRCLPLASPVMFGLHLVTDLSRRHSTGAAPPDRHRSLIFKMRTLNEQHIRTRSNGFSFRSRRRGGNNGGDMVLMDAPLCFLGTPPVAAFSSSSSSRPASAQISFFLSVPDFRLFLKVARRLARELDAGKQHIRTLESARANRVLTAATRMVPATDATLGLAAIPEQLVEEAAVTPSSTNQLFVSLDDLRFTLVNNSLGVPIAYAGTSFPPSRQFLPPSLPPLHRACA